MALKTIILAAGKGTRMKSNLPKVLHPVAGKPMLHHVVEAASSLGGDITIVYGHGGDQVKDKSTQINLKWAEQVEQLGTGHAVQQAQSSIEDDDTVLILYGDVPLTNPQTLKKLVSKSSKHVLALLTVKLDKPTGYGRIIRQNNNVERIVEQKDASEAELLVTEVNTGILAVNGQHLKSWLSKLQSNNAQGEFYLTDIIEMAVNDGVLVETVSPDSEFEVMGVNSKRELNIVERHYQKTQAEALMDMGVTLADANRIDIRGELDIQGTDIYIDVNCVFEGKVTLGSHVNIAANCNMTNTMLADGVTVKPNSVLEDCRVGENSSIGPYARLRPGAVLNKNVHVGNFVEIKKTNVGDGSKISHLSYIGDAEIGKAVNIGAGTITCNYDGVSKFKTIIEDDVFIGSDTQLVAPVVVKKGATIGAGTTLTKTAPEGELTLSRAKQITLKGWKKPTKD
jgi:bifunctional UDP-N-acetylglucosamine pyrophosphorylase/glucosamine-1-phosphate N-acetyltransferase